MGIYWHALSPGDQKDDFNRSLSENVVDLSKTGECRSVLVSSVRLLVESTQLDDDEVDLDVVGDLDEHKPKTIISSFGFMIVLRFWCVGIIMSWWMNDIYHSKTKSVVGDNDDGEFRIEGDDDR